MNRPHLPHVVRIRLSFVGSCRRSAGSHTRQCGRDGEDWTAGGQAGCFSCSGCSLAAPEPISSFSSPSAPIPLPLSKFLARRVVEEQLEQLDQPDSPSAGESSASFGSPCGKLFFSNSDFSPLDFFISRMLHLHLPCSSRESMATIKPSSSRTGRPRRRRRRLPRDRAFGNSPALVGQSSEIASASKLYVPAESLCNSFNASLAVNPALYQSRIRHPAISDRSATRSRSAWFVSSSRAAPGSTISTQTTACRTKSLQPSNDPHFGKPMLGRPAAK